MLKAEALNNKANFIILLADEDPSPSLSWCPDCMRSEPVIYKKLEAIPDDVALLRAYVKDGPTWRTAHHPWRVDSKFKRTGVPTLLLMVASTGVMVECCKLQPIEPIREQKQKAVETVERSSTL
ncbi:hypothetical protein ACFX19_020399 [Malus domestica]